MSKKLRAGEHLSAETLASYEANRKIRRDWGDIKPVTRIIPDKRNKKPKHRKEVADYED